jgi:beta-N-acetylhexosaminidase
MHELVAAIDVQPAARIWGARTSGRFAVVRLEARPNSAIGPTAWGPFAEVARYPESAINAAFAARPHYTVTADGPRPSALNPDDSVLVVGRDIHRHPFARAAVDQLRRDQANVLVVDMGWPSDDRRYADVATFGSSTAMGQALLALLAAGADRDHPV